MDNKCDFAKSIPPEKIITIGPINISDKLPDIDLEKRIKEFNALPEEDKHWESMGR